MKTQGSNISKKKNVREIFTFSGEAGDIHFDDDEHWTINKETVGTNFVWAAVHEIGHAIGLQHSHNPKSIMIPQYPGYEANLKLYEDDIMAIQAKYGKKQRQYAACVGSKIRPKIDSLHIPER